MASTPTELLPQPSQPATPDPVPTELPSPQPDIDMPDTTTPSTPDIAPGQPVGGTTYS